MQPNKDVAIARQTGLGLSLREMTWVGKVFYKSGMFSDTKDEAVAIVKIMAGQEMGLAPFEAMTGINIIKGRPTLAAATIGAKIKGSRKYDYRVKVATEIKSQIDFYEIENGKRTLIGSSTYTIGQAESASLLSKDNWKMYPEDMLFARNISRGSRRHTPDVFSTPVYTTEELEEELAPGGLNYVPVDGGNSNKELPAESEKVNPPTIDEPPEDDDELDDSIAESEMPTEPIPPEATPPADVDDDFKAVTLKTLEHLDVGNTEQMRIIKDATGKITTKTLSDHEWRKLSEVVNNLLNEGGDKKDSEE